MGNRLLYYLLILPISHLPYPALYLFSDLAFVLIFYVFKYRRKVVSENITNSFPAKDSSEIREIERRFYHHFCDLIVETLKGFTVSRNQVRARFAIRNPEVADVYCEQGKNVVFVGGHFNNWEVLAQGVGYEIKHLPIGLYKALHNVYLDSKMKSTRERGRLIMVPTTEASTSFETDYGEPAGIIFGIDQSPSNTARSYWMTFLNQDTPVSYGAEKYAKAYDLPVIYCTIHKVKRGHYEGELHLITEDSTNEPYGAILEKSTAKLEDDIKANPEFWLWTHRRWKAKRPQTVARQEAEV